MNHFQARQAFLSGYLSKTAAFSTDKAMNQSTSDMAKSVAPKTGSSLTPPGSTAKNLKNSVSSSSYFKYQGQTINPMTSNGITPVGPLARTPSLTPTSAQSDQKIAGPTTVKSTGGTAITTPNAEAVVSNVAGAQAQTKAMATAPKSPTSWNPQTQQLPQPPPPTPTANVPQQVWR